MVGHGRARGPLAGVGQRQGDVGGGLLGQAFELKARGLGIDRQLGIDMEAFSVQLGDGRGSADDLGGVADLQRPGKRRG